MAEKGGVGFPLVLVVTIIIVAIVVVLVHIFVFQTKVKLEVAFEDLTDSVSEFGCSLLGPVRGSLCPT